MAYYYNTEFLDECIGRGLSTDDTFENLKTKVISGEDKIHDSIRNILSTKVGERFFLPEFGSKLYLALFETNTLISRDLIKMYAEDAIAKWEKRIVVTDIEVGNENDDNIVPVTIMYMIAGSNVEGSYVYPFNIGDRGEPDVYEMGSEID